MARAAKKTNPENLPADWEKEMEAQAALAAGAQRANGGGGKFFSIRAGVLSYDDSPMPGNQMAVVILADVMENSYYDAPFVEGVKASPKCFAFAKNEDDLEPHEAVDKEDYFERQSDDCASCEWNKFGTARMGRGKACANVMRLAMIPAGVYKSKGRNAGLEYEAYDDPEHFQKAEVAFLKLPVTSVKNYSKFVKQLAADVRRPPHGVVCNVIVAPDTKNQLRVDFEVVDVLPNDILSVVMPRHKAEQASIDFPYQPPLEEDKAAPQKANNKLRGKAAAKKR